ncbi:hypothetical protein MSAN_01635400 [Mycena sanguinolenta]|uniref:Uncharacterized protein n=1 Tax=Mycena sanguinolenta TaxID=230812 RepID=A0A8H7CX94_9AGAR|nr:hypothetical protein MSAN_01635400 [Mycena sanguinolenta]
MIVGSSGTTSASFFLPCSRYLSSSHRPCQSFPPPLSTLSWNIHFRAIMSLSATDALTLKRYGRDLMQDAAGVIAESIFFSAYGIFFAIAIYSIFQKGLGSIGSRIMLSVIIYLYASATLQWGLDVWNFFGEIHYFLMVPDVPIADRAELTKESLENLSGPQEALYMLNMIIADAVVIWRTWAVYGKRISAILIPCLLLLTSFVFAVIDIFCTSYSGTENPGVQQLCLHTALVAWVFSVATNLACTILIGCKAREHRKLTKELNITGQSRRMSAGKILSILVESGFIYSLLWITQFISFVDITRVSPGYYAETVLHALGNEMAGMYPTLIIIIFNFHYTIWEDPPTIGDGALSGSMQWAPNPNGSAMIETFRTERGTNVHLEAVIGIPKGNATADSVTDLGGHNLDAENREHCKK